MALVLPSSLVLSTEDEIAELGFTKQLYHLQPFDLQIKEFLQEFSNCYIIAK